MEHSSIAEAAEASEDEDEDEATAALVGGKSLWTARASGESQVRHGGSLELSVDTRYLQFFDPGSGLSGGHPKATAALADQPARAAGSSPDCCGLGAIPVPRPQQSADRGKL